MVISPSAVAGANAVAVIMTGMGDDGAAGVLEMKLAGPLTIAQDEATSVEFGIPNKRSSAGRWTPFCRWARLPVPCSRALDRDTAGAVVLACCGLTTVAIVCRRGPS